MINFRGNTIQYSIKTFREICRSIFCKKGIALPHQHWINLIHKSFQISALSILCISETPKRMMEVNQNAAISNPISQPA